MLTNIDHLGSFRGDDLSEADLDSILAFAFPHMELEVARTQNDTKWWDYRFVHPGHSFFLYSHLYGEAVERWRTLFGINPHVKLNATEHPIWRPLKVRKGNTTAIVGEELTKGSIRTGLWRGMAFADAYGIPYDRFIELGFQHAFNCNWERLPQPTALYSKGFVETVLKTWAQETKDLLRLPSDPRYLADAYTGHKWQTEQMEWLSTNIAARPQPHLALAQYGFRENRLTEAYAVNRFGFYVVDKAKALLT